jgi:GT2 family glycosyltransferase
MISVILLTYNRTKTAEKCARENIKRAGYPIDEIIHIDNGSDIIPRISADISIYFPENRGTAVGYNTGFRLARGHAVIPSTDMILPQNWLKSMIEHLTDGIGIAIIKPFEVKELRDAENVGPKLIKHELFEKIGYMHDDYSLYGHEDVEFGRRAKNAGYRVIDIPTTGAIAQRGEDTEEYVKWKQEQAHKSEKLLADANTANYPKYNPYG